MFHQCRQISPLVAAALLGKLRLQMTTEQENTVDALKKACPGYAVMRSLVMSFRTILRTGKIKTLETMQSCGVITLRRRPEAVPRLAENPCANAGMHFPRCRSARECERRGNPGRCAGSISSVASSPFVWQQSR